jgi:hypothetical protein
MVIMEDKKKRNWASRLWHWCGDHKEMIITAVVIIGGAVVGAAIRSACEDDDKPKQESLDDEDPNWLKIRWEPGEPSGPILLMRFFDADTGERYLDKDIGCHKSYADVMYDIAKDMEPGDEFNLVEPAKI